MKRVLLAIVLLSTTWAGAATFTATTSGNWNSTTTWGSSGSGCHNAYPCMTDGISAGDIVIINTNVTVTCPDGTVCSVGNSPATNAAVLTANGTGSLTIGTGGAGATFVYAGRVQFTIGIVTMGKGSKIQYDSSWSSASTTVAYTWDCTAASCSASAFLWQVNGNAGSHAAIEGDTFKDSTGLIKSGACTTANTCLAGAFNFDGGTVYSTANQGQGTISYLDIQDVLGSPVASNGVAAWITAVKTGSNSAFDHITVTNSGTFIVIETASATVGLTINGLAVTNSRYTLAPSSGADPGAIGCLNVIERSVTSATFSISNAYMDCGVNWPSTNSQYGIFTWRNIHMYRGPNGSNPGLWVGTANGSGISPTDLFDEYFIYPSAYITGGSDTNGRPNQPVCFMVNSILWGPKVSTSGQHIQSFTGGLFTAPASCATARIMNNTWGAAGSVVSSPPAETITSVAIAGGPLGQATTLTFSGNVILPDQFGYASMGFPFGRYSATLSSHILHVIAQNNVSYSTVLGGLTNAGDWQTNGAMGFEGNATQQGIVQSFNANLLWNSQSGTTAPAEMCDSRNANFISPNQPVQLMTNNACASIAASAPCICSTSGANDPAKWVVTGPQNDIIMTHAPVMVNPNYNVPTFDILYLIPSGLLGGVVGQNPATYWSGQTGWRNAWSASSVSYARGDIVSDSAGNWGGNTTYWRCVQAHTSSTMNRPSIGVDPANVYNDYNQFWEPAYFNYFRQQIFAGTTFTEGAVPLMTDINGNPEPMHMIGLLNQWLHQGMRTMEPTLWRGCLLAPFPSTTATECGNLYAPSQHIPPPPSTI